MCGIAGFFLKAQTAPSVLETMTSAIGHRGPDDFGYYGITPEGKNHHWKDEKCPAASLKTGLGFRRLSILDLSHLGAQPMASSDKRYWLVFNGEIYNYIEIRDRLKDHRFASQSDTEVLLEVLVRHKLDALNRLNGMFAFAFFDSEKKELLLARDPFGIKPLYYTQDQRGFFFASEIRALLTILPGKPQLRKSLLLRYLRTGWIPDPDTLFDGIFKLEPGHALSIDTDLVLRKHKYADIQFKPNHDLSPLEWSNRLEHALDQVIERQLRSDVPVAFFLSGGIDSSLLAVRSLEVQREEPTTFTVGFRWSKTHPNDGLDLESARLLSRTFPFKYREILLEPNIVSLLPQIVNTLEEPIADPAALCSFLICQEAAREFKVLISGQGGDELFGGYPVFQAGWLASKLQQMRVSGLRHLTQALPYSLFGARLQTVHRLRKIFNSLDRPWPEPFFALRSVLSDEEASKLMVPSLLTEQDPAYGRHEQYAREAAKFDSRAQEMYLDIKTYLPALNLTYTDKTSMAHSVEVRVPFLDLELARLVEQIPSSLKFNLKDTKILLKLYADRILPASIVHRKKSGFGLPIRDWLLEDLQPMAYDLLSESRLKRQGFFQFPMIETWMKEHKELKADHSQKIYSLMTLQLWLETFQAG